MNSYELGMLYNLPLDILFENPDQPRKVFTDSDIQVLADSIAEKGLLQPILVKELEGGKIIIVSGERRFRAHQLLERETIPAWFTTGDAEELALVENLVREDLSPMETAEALMKLKKRFGDKKQADLAKLIGKAKSTLSEYLSLNNFPPDIQDEIRGDNRFALRDLKKIAVKRNPEQLRELFEKYKNRVLKSNPIKRAVGEEARRNRLKTIQKYLDMLIHKTKAEDLALLHDEILTIRDSIGIIIFKIIDLQNKIDASNKATSPITKRKSMIRLNDDDD
jgi:ParB family chromosome partitioning protein